MRFELGGCDVKPSPCLSCRLSLMVHYNACDYRARACLHVNVKSVQLQAGLLAAEELRVNVRRHLTPVVVLAERCGSTLDRRDVEASVGAPFLACGITVKDGKHTLSLQMGEKNNHPVVSLSS
ncbi:hypothetical protein Q5P01_017717 [Channa striata]|uniref:Uncharacterized protein n=1 Tax=Channa striata TaxID=64152 RepID=A0AA88SJE8_CHASR|nr:hypothetical protein Q5P01_017717 [Channa striata]